MEFMKQTLEHRRNLNIITMFILTMYLKTISDYEDIKCCIFQNERNIGFVLVSKLQVKTYSTKDREK